MKLNKNSRYSLMALALFSVFLVVADSFFDAFTLRVINLSAIYIILALSLNLLNGFTGLFSLGHSGFMAVGAYVCALLTMTPAQKTMNFFLTPIVPWLANIQVTFIL